jgi:hypothetical protein
MRGWPRVRARRRRKRTPHEIHVMRHGEVLHQIGEEHHAAAQDAHQERRPAGVIARDLLRQLSHALAKLFLADQHALQ